MKGYILCLLKHYLSSGNPISYEETANRAITCFGYFGRMQLEVIEDFKDFIQIASTKNIDFLGNRKQLLLYSPANIEQERPLSRMKAQFHTDFNAPEEGYYTSH
ncbi:MAG: hypothetical protein FWH28_03080, partial [Clostridiales bacterium]|nr:hypothetical protein [Clostridiales bacterium]